MVCKTPLNDEHIALNARMVDYAGWKMPVQYESITTEYKAVRESSGIFDVSHMGRFFLSGPGAAHGLSRLVASRVSDLKPGAVRYSVVCNVDGGIKDDVLITCLEKDSFLVVVNASNREKLIRWFMEHLRGKDILVDRTLETAMIAVQGPKSTPIVSELFHTDLSGLKYFKALELSGGVYISRTGYTGENGFEITTPIGKIKSIWNKAVECGATPCGLGSRDILRLEMGFPLYGHELAEDVSPLEAGLKWVVNIDDDDFIGKKALQEELDAGSARRRIGYQLTGRGIPREECLLFDGDQEIGKTTSGGFSPQLKKGIGLALVEKNWKKSGELSIDIRGKRVPAEIKKPPFVPNRATG